MSMLQDPVRPLDPSSQQEFVEPGRGAEAEGGRPEPLGDQPLPLSSRPEPLREPGDDVRAALRARGPMGKTSFELASRGGNLKAEGFRAGALHGGMAQSARERALRRSR